MNIIVIGPPGVGKGTQASRLAVALTIPHVASGDLLRAVRAQDTPLGREAKGYMDVGQLVPDAVTIRIIEERLAQPDAQQGVILDGFPRTLPQAQALDTLFGHLGGASAGTELVLYLTASRETVLERMRGRWLCQQCGKVYGIKDAATAQASHCDACGAPLYQRSDETPEVQAHRYEVYLKDTMPVVEYYREHGVLVEIDGERDVEVVTADILNVVQGRE